MLPQALLEAAGEVLREARQRGLMLATAESCTGGLIAGCLTEIAGASDVFERGFVTYSNEAKQESLGVPAELIERDGAVSETVARAMAAGALAHSKADLAVAVTGVAGPGGGTAAKPVGLVHLAVAASEGETTHAEMRYGDLGRDDIRRASVERAFALLLDRIRRDSVSQPA